MHHTGDSSTHPLYERIKLKILTKDNSQGDSSSLQKCYRIMDQGKDIIIILSFF